MVVDGTEPCPMSPVTTEEQLFTDSKQAQAHDVQDWITKDQAAKGIAGMTVGTKQLVQSAVRLSDGASDERGNRHACQRDAASAGAGAHQANRESVSSAAKDQPRGAWSVR